MNCLYQYDTLALYATSSSSMERSSERRALAVQPLERALVVCEERRDLFLRLLVVCVQPLLLPRAQ